MQHNMLGVREIERDMAHTTISFKMVCAFDYLLNFGNNKFLFSFNK